MKKEKLYDSFISQLKSVNETTTQARGDPKLKSKLLLKLVSDNDAVPLSMHTSHNSHGDWHRHWAQGAFLTPIKAHKESM